MDTLKQSAQYFKKHKARLKQMDEHQRILHNSLKGSYKPVPSHSTMTPEEKTAYNKKYWKTYKQSAE
jgi:hypothetical protein